MLGYITVLLQALGCNIQAHNAPLQLGPLAIMRRPTAMPISKIATVDRHRSAISRRLGPAQAEQGACHRGRHRWAETMDWLTNELTS